MPSILINVSALSASRQLGITAQGMKGTIQRLTTGKRINQASDDATGLVAGESLIADAKTAHEMRKVANGSYFAAQAQDGYLQEATDQAQRAVELAAGGNSSAAEMTSVATLVTNAVNKANVAGIGATTITAGATAGANASTALASISAARGTIAAAMATAQSQANLYGIQEENATAQESNIMDADIGSEVVQLTKWQILSQANTSALSQANQASQTVLGLLK
jgi:flagellin